MSLIRWQPLKELDTLRHQINRLFDELSQGEREFGQFRKLAATSWTPTQEKVRELMVEQCQHQEHLQETMQQRAADSIGLSADR